jgi:hypothetical protein
MNRDKSMSKEHGLKLVTMPKRQERMTSPQEDILDQVHEILPRIKNLVVVVHTDDNNILAFHALDPNIELGAFLDVARLRGVMNANDYMAASCAPPPQPTIA